MDNDFGLWDVFVSMFWFMLLVAWFWMVISILNDLFRDRELHGGAKALWALFILVVPWLGVLIYVLVRGDAMNARQHQHALDQQAKMQAYLQAPSEASISTELRELADLRENGILTTTEYEQAKAKLLA